MSKKPAEPASAAVDSPVQMPMPDPKRTPVIFVNTVAGGGHLNGVVNLTFATAFFTPTHDSSDTIIDQQVAARLRMDLFCATMLRDTLNNIIEQNTKPSKTYTVN